MTPRSFLYRLALRVLRRYGRLAVYRGDLAAINGHVATALQSAANARGASYDQKQRIIETMVLNLSSLMEILTEVAADAGLSRNPSNPFKDSTP